MTFEGKIVTCIVRGRDRGDGQKPLHTYLVQVGDTVGKVWTQAEFVNGEEVLLTLASNNEMRFTVRVAR